MSSSPGSVVWCWSHGAGTQFPLKLSGALLATIPVALLFAFLQRHFVRTGNESGVKG